MIPQHLLLWKKFPILNDGFICLSDFMGNDAKIASRARTSYGNDLRNVVAEVFSKHFKQQITNYYAEGPGSSFCIKIFKDGNQERIKETEKEKEIWKNLIPVLKQEEQKDATLIRRLMRDRHTSPFEFCQVEFLVRAPIYVFRQWHRHRTASINEYSGRYKEMIDSMETTPPGKWRLQSNKNKQGSDGYLTEWDKNSEEVQHILDAGFPSRIGQTPGQFLSNDEETFHQIAAELYQTRLKLGIAKEQARKDLPVSNYSEMYWSCDLHNLLHFLTLRMDSHAQEEIRLYANQMGEIVKELFPVTWKAFEDYRLNAMQLTALDIEALKRINGLLPSERMNEFYYSILESIFTNVTERSECIVKLKRLGIL